MHSASMLLLPLLAFLVLWWIGYALVHRYDFSSKTVKRLDYFWLGAAALGLCIASFDAVKTDARVNAADGPLQYRAQLATVRIYFDDLRGICRPSIRTQFSPPDYDAIVNAIGRSCTWAKKVHEQLPRLASVSFDDYLSFPSLPELPPSKYDPGLVDDARASLERLRDIHRSTVNNNGLAASNSGLLRFWLTILLAVALAVRFTKLHAELRTT
jgi:hypothetical protein